MLIMCQILCRPMDFIQYTGDNCVKIKNMNCNWSITLCDSCKHSILLCGSGTASIKN